jgi:hypothetical protein
MDNLVSKFIGLLTKQGVSIKNNNFVKGRSAFNAHNAAENFLGAIDEDLSMSYELIEKAKKLLEQKQKESKTTFVPTSSTIPELYTHTSKSGSTTYWIKTHATKQLYILLSHDLSSPNLLVDAIIRLMSEETRKKLVHLAETMNIEEETDKHSIESLVSITISKNRTNSINSLSTMPKTFSTNEFTPTRVYFDLSNIPQVPKATPAWDSLTKRMIIEDTTLKGGEYFKAFMWSIFEENDKNRVFLYWYDDGNQGKSEAINTLKEVLAEGFTAFDFFNMNSHSAESIVDKRVLVQHEAIVKKLSAIQLVKQITGGDDIYINPKGRKAYSININAKIIVLSNNSPIVSSQGSELSRLLPIKNLPRTKEDYIPYFGQKLKDEIFDFLANCKFAYNNLKENKKDLNFLSIEEELSKADTFLDYAGQLIEILKANYEIRLSNRGENYTKWKKIQGIINKILEEDDSLKGNVSAATPQVLDFFEKWAKKHGGKFIRVGANKGFVGCVLVKKEVESLPSNLGDL